MLKLTDSRYDSEPTPPLSSLIRIAEVTSINLAACTARVTFDDDDKFTSYDLPVIQPNTLKNSDYRMPDVGEDAVCVFLPAGASEGFIIGSIYAGDVRPPSSSPDVRMVKFSDGTVLRYDRSAHKLTADVKGDIEVTATGKIDVSAAGDITLTSGGSITLFAAGALNLQNGGGNWSGGGNISIGGN